MVKEGENIRLVRLNAGERMSQRLTEMGLTPGTEFTVIQNTTGPLLLLVRDTRLALGRGMALKIVVEQLCEKED
ncbi:MAG: FeoA family protein [Chloroflexota bacterium]